MTEEEKRQISVTQSGSVEPQSDAGQVTQTAGQTTAKSGDSDVISGAPSKVDTNSPVSATVAPEQSGISMPTTNPIERREEMAYMMRNKPVGDEEGRERKRNRARSFVAAIGDGVSALANLYFTTQYAPNVSQQPSLSRQNKERFDKRMEEFRARRKEYEAGLQRAKDRDRDNNRYAQEWKFRMQQAKAAEQEKQRAAAAKEAAARAAEARHKDEMALKKADADERKRHNEALERNGARMARAAEVRASRGGAHEKVKHHFQGREYASEKDYTKDVSEAARDYNNQHKDEEGFEPIVTERKERTAYGTRVTPRKPEEYAGEVEFRLSQKKKSPTGSNGGGKKSPTS